MQFISWVSIHVGQNRELCIIVHGHLPGTLQSDHQAWVLLHKSWTVHECIQLLSVVYIVWHPLSLSCTIPVLILSNYIILSKIHPECLFHLYPIEEKHWRYGNKEKGKMPHTEISSSRLQMLVFGNMPILWKGYVVSYKISPYKKKHGDNCNVAKTYVILALWWSHTSKENT